MLQTTLRRSYHEKGKLSMLLSIVLVVGMLAGCGAAKQRTPDQPTHQAQEMKRPLPEN